MEKTHNCKLKKRLLSGFMSLTMLFFSVPAMGATENADIAEHWANSYMNSLQKQGIMTSTENGYEGDRAITRAELAQMAVNTFQYEKTGNAVFSDVPADAPYADAIAKAAGQGFLQGFDGKAKPLDPITREDTAVMFSRMLKSNSGKTVNSPDAADISDYALGSVAALWDKAYLTGDEKGYFNPKDNLTRGEAARLFSVVSGNIYNESREYDLHNRPISGNATITTGGVKLKNTVIEGDLYITEGVGDGEVTLENVEIKGETIVSGGGMNSIVFINTKTGMLKIEVPDGTPVRIVASGNSAINMVAANSESKLQDQNLTGSGFSEIVISVPANAKVSLDGKFDSVTMDSPNAALDILGGTIGKVSVAQGAENADIKIASTATVTDLNCDAGAKIGGTGSIGNATINANGVTIAQKPDNVEVKEGVTSTVNKETAVGTPPTNSLGTSSNENNNSNSGSGSGNNNSAKKLVHSYAEICYNPNSTTVQMAFSEPIEVLFNGSAASASTLNSAFAYSDGSKTLNIPYASIQNNILEFYVPTIIAKGTHTISLQEGMKNKGLVIKGKTSGNTLQQINTSLLQFDTLNPSDSNFTIIGPNSLSVEAGAQASFTVQVSGGSGTFYYQWYRNGAPISGATSSTYSFATGINDNNVKFHAVVSQMLASTTVRVANISPVAYLQVNPIGSKRVILEVDSLGIAGDASILGLTRGYRYYVVTDDDEGVSASYPVLAEGILGDKGVEITYDNLEGLNTTAITGLVNEKRYCVYRKTAEMPTLSAMIIKGGTDELGFRGYVPPTLTMEADPISSSLNVELQSDDPDAVFSVAHRVNKSAEWIFSHTYTDMGNVELYMTGGTNANYYQISVYPRLEPDVKQIYNIEVTKNSDLIVSPTWYYTDGSYHSLYTDNLTDLSYHTIYQKPSQKLTTITFGEYTLKESTPENLQDYSQQFVEYTGNTVITITKSFFEAQKFDESDYNKKFELTFTFTDDGGGTISKIGKFQVEKPTIKPSKYLSMGKPELLEGDIGNYISIYIPLFLSDKPVDNEEVEKSPVGYDDIRNQIYQLSLSLVTESGSASLVHHYSWGDIKDHTYWTGKTGMILQIGNLNAISKEAVKLLAQEGDTSLQLQLDTHAPDGSYRPTEGSVVVPLAKPTAGQIEFAGATSSPAFNAETKQYTLTVDDVFTSEFKQTADSSATELSWSIIEGTRGMADESGKYVTIYGASSKPNTPELIYLVAQQNTLPQVYSYEFEGNAVADGTYMMEHSGSLGAVYNNDHLSSWLNITSYYGKGYAYDTDELSSYNLDLDNTTYQLGSKPVSLQSLITGGYLTNSYEGAPTMPLRFSNVKTLINVFDINPVEDTIDNKITIQPKLKNANTKYQPIKSEVSLNSNSGQLKTLAIKDKVGGNATSVEPTIDTLNAVEIPYPDVTIMTASSGDYECVVYDKHGLPVDGNNGIILTKDVPERIAIVIAKGNVVPKVYQFELTYEPAPTKTRAAMPQQATVTFEHYFDDELGNTDLPEQQPTESLPETLPLLPLEPIVPDAPITPEEPLVPDTPITPEEPIVPDTPIIPEKPIIPDESIVPEEPIIPEEPVIPDESTVPEEPIIPEEPLVPDEPIQ